MNKGIEANYWFNFGYKFADSCLQNEGMHRNSINSNDAFERFWRSQSIEETISYEVAKVSFFEGITSRYTEFQPHA